MQHVHANTMQNTIPMLATVRDKITGEVGQVTGRAEYLHGEPCVRMEYQRGDGVWKFEWVIESRLEIVQDGTVGQV